MRRIEVKTSHNIILSFELAPVMQRILATFIDLGVVSLGTLILSSVVGIIGVGYVLIVFPFIMFYNLLFEIFNNGQTIGKKLLGIRVVSIDGSTVSIRNSIIRWAFRLVDIVSTSGILAILSIYSSDKSQRLGDLLANTTVISLNNTNPKSLESLSKLDDLDFEITYPAVVMYNDQDMLIVKDALTRKKQGHNLEVNMFCIQLAKRIKTDLGITDNKVGYAQFLSKILDDYIMITR